MNRNTVHARPDQGYVMFVDMNSFFASCEQQMNYYLRGRPVGVCVYTGENGCVIAPSIEARQRGVKTGMRLREAIRLCPELVPLESRPERYREFHVRIIEVLRRYAQEVIPKSIDEAVIDLRSYKRVYPDLMALARQIKTDIREQVGEWLRCSIGIAPNAFLAKLGTELQKPDGLVMITPENIDQILAGLSLTDLPGIAERMAQRLKKGGIHTPLELRHASPHHLRQVCQSIVGLHWHYRLNFAEVDIMDHPYKTMQAMRQISAAQRQRVESLHDLLVALCMTLERRMVNQRVCCREVTVQFTYTYTRQWHQVIRLPQPVQEGTWLLQAIRQRMEHFVRIHHCEPLINDQLTAMGISVSDFVPEELVPLSLFEEPVRRQNLLRAVYDIKDRFGPDKLIKAVELSDAQPMKDAIGFGSVKDLHARQT
ncbi:DNA polymerase Y family protein [Thermoflavifilum thermophilum]|uniref:DNA polymerase-4 n=1 Tax=Thermoflavifilum thermophilum TaxID=1393122 RepID=A0A1I7N6E1_9BACT|nr:DNA polymerase IV [Thermoflavifilum thermophilum]SFV30126.1 DNA polymerase-4 [Thermoflavifilum thermophilum]